MKRDRWKFGVLATVFLFSGLTSPAQAEPEPVVPAAPVTKVRGAQTVDRDGCTPAAIEAAAARTSTGLVSCGTSRSVDPRSSEARDALAKMRGEVTAQDYQEPPQWCYDHAFDGWWGTRTQMCSIRDNSVTLYRFQPPSPPTVVGTAKFLELNYSYTSADIDIWAHQIRTRKYNSTGAGTGSATISGFSSCDGDCKQISDSGLRPGNFASGKNNDGEAYNESTRGEVGGIGNSEGRWEYWIQYSNFTPTDPYEVDLPTVRCDNALGDNENNSGDPFSAKATFGAGCVFLGVMPVMVYSKSGPYRELALHIEAAQQSGLPGAYPNGAVLNRITNRTDKDANGRAACPAGWTRPTDRTCDEYPFRSTTQGASTQVPKGTARTFATTANPWCVMDPAWGVPTGVTGPTGWSSCMIDAEHNRNGGAALGAFYKRSRVLNGDAFLVQIIP